MIQNHNNQRRDGRPGNSQPKLPEHYLEGGYYEIKGGKKVLRCEYIVEFPQEIANSLTVYKKTISFQVRKLYAHCVQLNEAIKRKTFDEIQPEFKRLIPFVTNAHIRDRVPQLFVEFIKKNVTHVKDKHDFIAFFKHFEALVAFLPKENN